LEKNNQFHVNWFIFYRLSYGCDDDYVVTDISEAKEQELRVQFEVLPLCQPSEWTAN